MHDLQVQYIIILVSQDFILYPIFSLLDSFSLPDDALLAGTIIDLSQLKKVT